MEDAEEKVIVSSEPIGPEIVQGGFPWHHLMYHEGQSQTRGLSRFPGARRPHSSNRVKRDIMAILNESQLSYG
eukprot:scaffold339949_cov32-Prasinocladus_malaysianus.AAC.1